MTHGGASHRHHSQPSSITSAPTDDFDEIVRKELNSTNHNFLTEVSDEPMEDALVVFSCSGQKSILTPFGCANQQDAQPLLEQSDLQ